MKETPAPGEQRIPKKAREPMKKMRFSPEKLTARMRETNKGAANIAAHLFLKRVLKTPNTQTVKTWMSGSHELKDHGRICALAEILGCTTEDLHEEVPLTHADLEGRPSDYPRKGIKSGTGEKS